MDVKRYTFQSPYPSQVQIGRPDPTVKQEQSSNEASSDLLKNTNEVQKKATAFEATQKQEVQAQVATNSVAQMFGTDEVGKSKGRGVENKSVSGIENSNKNNADKLNFQGTQSVSKGTLEALSSAGKSGMAHGNSANANNNANARIDIYA